MLSNELVALRGPRADLESAGISVPVRGGPDMYVPAQANVETTVRERATNDAHRKEK